MWALQFTCIKLVQDQVGSLFTVWGPMTLATIMLYPLINAEKKNKTKSAAERHYKGDILTFFILALFGIFPGQILVTWGTRMSLASNAALLMLALPVCTAAMAFIFLGERMTWVRWLSFGLAIAGVIICSAKDFHGFDLGRGYLLGNSFIFLGVLGSAFYNSYSKKLLERYSEMQMLFYTYLAMFVILTPLVLVEERQVFANVPHFTIRTWIGLALLTFFHNYLSMVLFLKALKQLDATQAALSNYLITIFGVAIAAIWLGEKLGVLAIVGGLMVLAGTLLITLWQSRRTSAPLDASAVNL